jgi:SAM-dependent methyltransferase
MREALKHLLREALCAYPVLRKALSIMFSRNVNFQKMLLQLDYHEQTIRNQYSEESLAQKRLFNIGAGNQRSRFDFWTYLDLKTDTYNHEGIDLYFDLEALEPLPIESDYAEVIFSSFVIEHISKEATKNLAKEALRSLKQGGVFHNKVHCYDYGLRLLKAGLITPKLPFEGRETRDIIEQFITEHQFSVKSYYKNGSYIISSSKSPDQKISISPEEAFLYHNAIAAIPNIEKSNKSLKDILHEVFTDKSNAEGYEILKEKYVDHDLKKPHHHNADYWGPNKLIRYLKSIGFSDAYATQPYQSVSSALWEESLNPIHYGFTFSIEAIK